VADIALLYPVESIWPKFRPARHWANDSAGATGIENTWRAAAEGLFASQRDFTVVDSRTLAEANVEAGELVHGKLRWRVVILPGVDTLPEAAWKNLKRYVQSGGVLIALGALPANSEREFPSMEVKALAGELFGESKAAPAVMAKGKGGAGIYLPPGSEGLLPVALDGVLERDLTVPALRSPLRTAHRRIDGRDVWFVINDSSKPWQGEVTLSASGAGERWDPGEGVVAQTNLGSRVGLNLEPYGATLLRYPAAKVSQRHAPRGGTLPNLAQRDLPEVKPAMAQGEFVRTELVPDTAHSVPGRPAWLAASKLTKGQVDTFMFVRFLFPEPLNLEGAECLVIDAWIPEGQQTGTQLLAILQEKAGGDFIANTGGLLGTPGHHRLFVPLTRLQHAGWSQDKDGELDLKQISEVRIGWGGYFGTEGEQVQFSIALPQVGSITARTSPR
jgi:hypothetical protein